MKSFGEFSWGSRILRVLAVVLLAFSLLPAQQAAAAPKAPQKVAAVSVSKDALALTWSAVAGATSYKVSYSTSSSMKSAKSVTSKSASAELKKLKSKTTYYVTVVANTKKGKSATSKKLKLKTASTSAANTHLSPAGLKVTSTKAEEAKISWTSRGSGLTYHVSVATKSSFSGAKSYYVKGTSTTVKKLKGDATHYVRVRVVSAKKAALSGYSSSVKVKVKAAAKPKPAPEVKAPVVQAPVVQGPEVMSPPVDSEVKPSTPDSVGNGGPAEITVASYNVGSKTRDADTHPWEQRRDAVASTIKSQAPDVIGLQEASQGKFEGVDLSQAEDLVNRMGSPYKLANTARYNCENAKSPYMCVPMYRGASNSQKIAYNSDTVEVLGKGSVKTVSLKTRFEEERYVEWALFRHLDSGKQFFFVNVHLDPGKDKNTIDIRKKQMDQILAMIAEKNPGKLPTYIVGDFNSHKWTEGGNLPYDRMLSSGYVDPLGNSYMSTKTTEGATVKNRINTQFSGFNGWDRIAPQKAFVNGIYLDYIFTSKGIEVPEWETVVNVDKNGRFVGTIPSDHNMLRATTVIK